MIARWIVGVVLLFGILLLLLPKSDEESRTKISSASMLMCTKAFRAEVAAQLLRGEAIDREFKNSCPSAIASLEVDEAGGMVLTGAKYPLKMTLSPVVENGKVRWSCVGEPEGDVTKLCKP